MSNLFKALIISVCLVSNMFAIPDDQKIKNDACVSDREMDIDNAADALSDQIQHCPFCDKIISIEEYQKMIFFDISGPDKLLDSIRSKIPPGSRRLNDDMIKKIAERLQISLATAGTSLFDIRYDCNRTVLHFACDDKGNLDCVKILLQAAGDNVWELITFQPVVSYGSTTAFHLASLRGHLDIINEFFATAHKLDKTWELLSLQNKEGITALHSAIRGANLDVIYKFIVTADTLNRTSEMIAIKTKQGQGIEKALFQVKYYGRKIPKRLESWFLGELNCNIDDIMESHKSKNNNNNLDRLIDINRINNCVCKEESEPEIVFIESDTDSKLEDVDSNVTCQLEDNEDLVYMNVVLSCQCEFGLRSDEYTMRNQCKDSKTEGHFSKLPVQKSNENDIVSRMNLNVVCDVNGDCLKEGSRCELVKITLCYIANVLCHDNEILPMPKSGESDEACNDKNLVLVSDCGCELIVSSDNDCSADYDSTKKICKDSAILPLNYIGKIRGRDFEEHIYDCGCEMSTSDCGCINWAPCDECYESFTGQYASDACQS